MAEFVLAPVINQTFEIASNLIVTEASCLYWLKTDMDWLQRELSLMQSYLNDAQAKEAGDHRVATLIKQIEELALDVEDLLDTYLLQTQSHKGNGHFRWLNKVADFFGSSVNANKFAMEVEKIKRRVKEIDEARTTYGISETDGGRERNIDGGTSRRSILYADEPEIIGCNENAKELEHKLLDSSLQCGVTSIVGMAGLGKTTLAKRIYNRVKHRFDCSAIEYVSQVPNIKDLLQSISRQVGVVEKLKEHKKLEDLQLDDLQHEWRSFFKERKYVILLDDIWTKAAWDDLKCVFPNNPRIGSRLIITSRNNDVGRYIGGENSLHELKLLNSEDSITLFRKSIMTHQGDTSFLPDLEDIGRKIVEKCGGLPLAIVLTAGILRARERNERRWTLVLNRMGHSKQDECSKILALSYMDLPSQLKPCFLYLGLFPEHHEIPAFCLINMWVAEKFIRANGTQEVEEVGEEYIYELAARNLVQVVKRGFDGRIKSCRIHDLLHNLCINMAEENSFFHTLDTLEKSDPKSVMKVRRFTTHLRSIDDYIALNPQMPKLRALLCFCKISKLNKEGLRMIFGEHRLSRVLRVDSSVLFVPKRIRNMRQLSYLEAYGVYAHSSRFKELKNLQSLYLRGLIYGDSDHMWKIEQLRHLASDSYHFFSLPTDVSLPNLQTLDIPISRFERNTLLIANRLPTLRRLRLRLQGERPIFEALSGMTTPMMPKIESLKLDLLFDEHRQKPERVNLSSYLNLDCLRLDIPLEKLPNADEFPPNLIKINLRHSELTEDPMETLGRLPKLKILKLDWKAYMGESIHCSGVDSFPHLKVLVLRGLFGLKEVMIDDGSLLKLETLVIQRCNYLTKIPQRFRNITRMYDI